MAQPPAGLWGRGRLTAGPGRSKVPWHLPGHPPQMPMPGDPDVSLDGPTQMDPLDGPTWMDLLGQTPFDGSILDGHLLDGHFLDGSPLMDPMIDPY